METDNNIQSNIEEYLNLTNKFKFKSDFKFSTIALISKYEQLLKNKKENNIHIVALSSSIIRFIIFSPKATNLKFDEKTVYIWPFQFLHCDFISTIIPALQQNRIPYRIIVMRQNLVPYLSSKGIEAQFVVYKVSFRKVSQIFKETISLFLFVLNVIFSKKDYFVKKAMLSLLMYINMPIMAKAASEATMHKHSSQYHLVGYDLSVMGISIINVAHKYDLPTGRIQNGAPNYILSGYSKVDELFMWDIISKNAYLNNGFKGKTIITGNVLLQRMIAKGFADCWIKEIQFNRHYIYKIFVAFSGPGHNTTKRGHLETLKELEMIISEFPDYAFFVKLHSKDSKVYYQHITKYSNVFFTDDLPSRPDALSILSKSDMIITGGSSVALDALQMNIPVISIDPLFELNHYHFLRDYQIFNTNTTKNREEIKQQLLSILKHKKEKIFEIKNSGVETIVKTISAHL